MKEYISNNFDFFTDDFLRELTPRTVIIVGSSKIDDLLVNIISNYLLPKIVKNKDQDELLEGDKPLATFSSRIKLVYRLGIIHISLYQVLEKIRNIRNISAHEMLFDIAKSPLKDRINSLYQEISKKNSFILTKERYFNNDIFSKLDELKCSFLTICVLLEAINAKIEKVKVNLSIINISLR